MKNKENKLAKL